MRGCGHMIVNIADSTNVPKGCRAADGSNCLRRRWQPAFDRPSMDNRPQSTPVSTPRTSSAGVERRLSVGAEIQPGGGAHFRVWAPAAREVAVEFDDRTPHPLLAE